MSNATKIQKLKRKNKVLKELLVDSEERNLYLHHRLRDSVHSRAYQLGIRRLVYGPKGVGKTHFVVNKLLRQIPSPVLVIDYDDPQYDSLKKDKRAPIHCLDNIGVKTIRSIHKKNPSVTFIFEASTTGFFMGNYGQIFHSLYSELKFNFIIVASNPAIFSPLVTDLIDFTYCLGGVSAYRRLFRSPLAKDLDHIVFIDNYNPNYR